MTTLAKASPRTPQTHPALDNPPMAKPIAIECFAGERELLQGEQRAPNASLRVIGQASCRDQLGEFFPREAGDLDARHRSEQIGQGNRFAPFGLFHRLLRVLPGSRARVEDLDDPSAVELEVVERSGQHLARQLDLLDVSLRGQLRAPA
jgi:hypothetical protein